MKSLCVLTIVAIFCISNIQTSDLIVGNVAGAQLAYMENVSLSWVPFTVREKNVFHENNKTIKAIVALDLNKSKARVIISAGGVGFNFVNVNIKSERGSGLDYQVSIYA